MDVLVCIFVWLVVIMAATALFQSSCGYITPYKDEQLVEYSECCGCDHNCQPAAQPEDETASDEDEE